MSRLDFLKQLFYWITLPAGAGVYAVFVERYWPEVRTHTVYLDRLPVAFDGLRIVQFSDVHLGHYYGPRQLADVVDQIHSLQADLIAFTGDLYDRDLTYERETTEILARLSAPLGKWAVVGNHDYRAGAEAVGDLLRRSGFQLLHNRHSMLSKDGAGLLIAGVDDTLHGRPDIGSALQGITEEICTILLVHEPDFADVSKLHGVDLQLSGHTHGGQVRMPFIGHLVLPPHGEKYPDGLQQLDDSTLQVYTNRGIGTTGLPVRFFCRPEITLLTLRRRDRS
ncbi:metallophosphoesterase [Brevibacillus humidisoli]|uniref:metallophosphoesterase n=1 Tax=Brevibacillus humidisoli TaxID=2895522 RepID=UPI001E34EBF2|nr:metallophosphoesterase [Brevibacillus humidisoli]UFJ42897.1 metallophosphoesterase [Brevibacillus humidisoli]